MSSNLPANGIHLDLTAPANEELSPYSPLFPFELLSNSIKKQFQRAQNAAQTIYDFAASEGAVVTHIQQALREECRYVVDMGENLLNAVESGQIKLNIENGKTFAQIRDANGHYGTKIPIKREVFHGELDPLQLSNALQMQALQKQITSIAAQINCISDCIGTVLQELQNDRIGLYYSGLALYMEAKSLTDAGMKQALLAQSLRALTEATFQLSLNMQSDIQSLKEKSFRKGRGKSVVLLDECVNSINQTFAYIHQAMMLRAGIYCELGQIASMATVLNEYSYFIDNNIVPNANLLAEFDKNDTGTETGTWKSRAQLKLDVADFSKQLGKSNQIFYLGIEKEVF